MKSAVPEDRRPCLLFIVGPPAVGKMTVGFEIAKQTGFRLFHNHMAIEPVLRFFEFGSPSFHRLVGGFRQSVFDEVAASDLPGLIFTYVWDFDDPEEEVQLEHLAKPFRDRDARVLFAELSASREARLIRNEGSLRLAEKPSKRNVERSRQHMLEIENAHRLNSAGEFDHRADYLKLDNTELPPETVAVDVVDHFGLQRLEVADSRVAPD